MYVSAWPGLRPALPLQKASASLPFPFSEARGLYGYLARGLIYQLFRALDVRPGEFVLAPDYHHGNEIQAIRAAGADIRYYHVDRTLALDLEEIERLAGPGCRAVFVIHYFGWPAPITELHGLCRSRGIRLVEDCALSLFAEVDGRPVGSFGDDAIFCLYKTLPVPNGGLLVENGPPLPRLESLSLRPPGRVSVYGRSLDLALEGLKGRRELLGGGLLALKQAAGTGLSLMRVRREAVGDLGFDFERASLDISPLSKRILERLDLSEIAGKRRANYAALEQRLAGRAAYLKRPLTAGTCPLFFPLLVEDKQRAVEKLRARGIGAVEFWNALPGAPEASRDVAYLRSRVIELPVHQDVTPEQLDYVAAQVLDLGLGAEVKGAQRVVMRVEVTTGGLEVLGRVAREWSALADEGPAADPFFRPEWIDLYLRCFEPEARLVLLTARRGDELRGVLPLVDESVTFCGLPARRLRAPVNEHSCRFDLVAGGGDRRPVVRALWGTLKELPGWDVLEVRDVPEDGAIEDLRALAEVDEWPSGRRASMDTPYVPLAPGLDVLHMTDAKFRANLRRRLKKLESIGPVSMRRVDALDAATIADFYRLERAGWKGEAGSAIECRLETRRFYDGMVELAAARGELAIYVLECGGEAVAVQLGLVSQGRYFVVKPTYDEQFRECSPGQLLMEKVLLDCTTRGLGELDFLGPWMPWKGDWTTRVRPHSYYYVLRSSLYGSLLHIAKFHAVPFARRVMRPELVGPRTAAKGLAP